MPDDKAAVVDSPSTDSLASLNSEQYKDCQLTGKLPEPKKEDSAPSPAPAKAEAKAGEPAEAPASEPGKAAETIEIRRAKTERRFKELLADRDSAKAKNAELELRIAELEKPTTIAEKQPATAAEKTVEGDPKPKYEDFNDIEVFAEKLAEWVKRQTMKET